MISQEQLESRYFREPKTYEKSVIKTIHKFTKRHARAVLDPIMPTDIQNIVIQYAEIDESLPVPLQARHNIIYCYFMFIVMQIVSWITLIISIQLRTIEVLLIMSCVSDQRFRAITHLVITKLFQNKRSSFVPLVLQYQVRYASMSVYFVDHWCPSEAYFASLGFSKTSVLIANICLFILFCIVLLP